MTPLEWTKNVISVCVAGIDRENEQKTQDDAEKLAEIYNNYSAEQQESVHQILREQFQMNDALYILSFLVKYLNLDAFWEDIIWHVCRENKDCFVGSMVEAQLEIYGTAPYKQKRMLHRNNVRNFMQALNLPDDRSKEQEKNKNRIVIVTEQLLSIKHAPTLITLEFAYILQEKMNYEVCIITCPLDAHLPFDLWVDPRYYYGGFEGVREIPYKGVNIKNIGFSMEDGSLERCSRMLHMIAAWRPWLVLELGVTNPLADLCREFTTTVAMAMTTECPVSEADILIRYVPGTGAYEEACKKELLPYQKQIFMQEKLPVIAQEAEKECVPDDLGLPEGKFFVAVVGNRLDLEIDEAFLNIMKQIMDAAENVDFAIIGDAEKLQEKLEGTSYGKRIHFLGYCMDLLGTYRALHLYLNPRRLGGGWSSAMALMAGLPVVTLPACDVAYNVGDEFTVMTEEEIVDAVVRYASDDVFYGQKKRIAIEKGRDGGEQKMLEYVTSLFTRIQENME